jgi:hypothetical protein
LDLQVLSSNETHFSIKRMSPYKQKIFLVWILDLQSHFFIYCYSEEVILLKECFWNSTSRDAYKFHNKVRHFFYFTGWIVEILDLIYQGVLWLDYRVRNFIDTLYTSLNNWIFTKTFKLSIGSYWVKLNSFRRNFGSLLLFKTLVDLIKSGWKGNTGNFKCILLEEFSNSIYVFW